MTAHDSLPTPIRAFIAVPLSEIAIAAAKRLQDRLRARLTTDAVRWTPAAQLHLTLKFLGDIDPACVGALTAALNEQCRTAASFRLKFSQLGCFPSFVKPNVIWIGIDGEVAKLTDLAARIELAAKQFCQHSEERDFHPHLTIGRIRPGGRKLARALGAKLAAESSPIEAEWIVPELILFRSELTPKGANHLPLARVPLSHAP